MRKTDDYFKELIIVNSRRVYDSCATKDYLENLRCYFTESNQSIIEQSINIKPKSIEIINVNVDIDSAQFQNNLFLIKQNFYFDAKFEVEFLDSNKTINSLCLFSKKMTMYGSNINIKEFSSKKEYNTVNKLPTAIVRVSEPIIFNSSLNDVVYADDLGKIPIIPHDISEYFIENLAYTNIKKYVNITLGLFTITHIERNVQMLIPCCDFGKPKKEYIDEIDTKEKFNKMEFPIDNFFPSNNTFFSFN